MKRVTWTVPLDAKLAVRLNSLFRKRLLSWASEIDELARVAEAEGATSKTAAVLKAIAEEMRREEK